MALLTTALRHLTVGHEKLDTTAIYIEVSIKQLQEVHARCHPAAQLSERQNLLPLPPEKA